MNLPSAWQLQRLAAIEKLYAWGSTRFSDGDLSALAKLPEKSGCVIGRHYRPHVAELVAEIGRSTLISPLSLRASCSS